MQSITNIDQWLTKQDSRRRRLKVPNLENPSSLPRRLDENGRALDEAPHFRLSKLARPERSSAYFMDKLTQPVRLRPEDISGMESIARDFLQRCAEAQPDQDASAAIETLSVQIEGWRANHYICPVSTRDFDSDLALGKNSNKAVMQRTLVMSLIDNWQLGDLFTFNCEGQWRTHTRYHVPNTAWTEGTMLPKPDLAIFFKLAALTGGESYAPYPMEIRKCLWPDGCEERCFPFFMEWAADNVESALTANLCSASQALYNISIWMFLAQHNTAFFNQVRVFSVVLDIRKIRLRLHRAELENGCFSFYFDEIAELNKYNKDQAYGLIRRVLKYAESEPHGILQKTFRQVSQQEQARRRIEARILATS